MPAPCNVPLAHLCQMLSAAVDRCRRGLLSERGPAMTQRNLTHRDGPDGLDGPGGPGGRWQPLAALSPDGHLWPPWPLVLADVRLHKLKMGRCAGRRGTCCHVKCRRVANGTMTNPSVSSLSRFPTKVFFLKRSPPKGMQRASIPCRPSLLQLPVRGHRLSLLSADSGARTLTSCTLSAEHGPRLDQHQTTGRPPQTTADDRR